MNIQSLTKPLIFEKVENPEREKNLLRVLVKLHTTKNEKYWLVGFLQHVGYNEHEIYDIIERFNAWEDYNKDITKHFIAWFFNKKCGSKPDYASVTKSAPLSPDEMINYFLCNCKPFFPIKTDNIKDMAVWYHSRGFHVIPSAKNDVKKPYPGIKWLAFQDTQPSFDMVSRWDWAHGLILIGTQKHCFLDIDMKSDHHKDGLDFFDEGRLKGFAYERTRSGGYHVFGLGNMRYMKAEPVSIRGKGAYIVTAPTPGYVGII